MTRVLYLVAPRGIFQYWKFRTSDPFVTKKDPKFGDGENVLSVCARIGNSKSSLMKTAKEWLSGSSLPDGKDIRVPCDKIDETNVKTIWLKQMENQKR